MGDVDVFMKFYVGDFLRDTAELSAEEVGVYIRLLSHMWTRHGWLKLDHERLARLGGCDNGTWERIWPTLMGFFAVDEGGNLTQKRLAKELEQARSQKRLASESGRRGADARWSGGRTPPPTTSGSMATPLGSPMATVLPTAMANAQQPQWRNDGSSESESESEPKPDPEPAPAPSGQAHVRDPYSQAEEPDPGVHAPVEWRSGYAWLDAFRKPWCKAKKRLAYGSGGDLKAAATLELVLAGFPEVEAKAIWEQREKLIGRYLRDRDSWLVGRNHPFSGFVTRFSDYLPDEVPVAAAGGAPDVDQDCEYHAGAKNSGRAAAPGVRRKSCAECRHIAARASPRPATEPSALGELVQGSTAGR